MNEEIAPAIHPSLPETEAFLTPEQEWLLSLNSKTITQKLDINTASVCQSSEANLRDLQCEQGPSTIENVVQENTTIVPAKDLSHDSVQEGLFSLSSIEPPVELAKNTHKNVSASGN